MDKSPEVAVTSAYLTTVTPWVEGDTQARESLHLTGENGEESVALRDCILRHCFRELDAMDDNEWENQKCCALQSAPTGTCSTAEPRKEFL